MQTFTRKALVTGGAGFIGSHLVERLLDDGLAVAVIDNCSTGSRANLEPVAGRAGFSFIEGSATDEELLAAAMDGCHEVYHLAAAVGVMRIVSDPVATIEENVLGTGAVLRAAAGQPKPPRLFLASTSEVYGRSEAVPFHEESDVLYGPTSCSRWSYAYSKAVAEYLALAYHKERRLSVTIGRLFNVVGPRQTGAWGMVLPRFVGQALAGGPIEVFGDGEQTRVFLHVREAVDAIRRLTQEKTAETVFNIGGTEEVSIGALARRVKERVNPEASIRQVPYAQAYEEGFEDLRRRAPNLERIRAAIGFAPAIGLNRIIDEVAAAIRGSEKE